MKVVLITSAFLCTTLWMWYKIGLFAVFLWHRFAHVPIMVSWFEAFVMWVLLTTLAFWLVDKIENRHNETRANS